MKEIQKAVFEEEFKAAGNDLEVLVKTLKNKYGAEFTEGELAEILGIGEE